MKGRPDFTNRRFGVTNPKRFPPYVYSKLGGMLVHKILRVDLSWWEGHYWEMVRLRAPRITYHTVCGMSFYGGEPQERHKRSATCAMPRDGAVLCGRCQGLGPVFGRGLKEKNVTREEAKRRIGCAVEAR
jgi:hypothetical protein